MSRQSGSALAVRVAKKRAKKAKEKKTEKEGDTAVCVFCLFGKCILLYTG